ncbi:MAG: sodium-dependent transporter [Deltaproteobacteria bacterium]|nr:sodium-dependent transporter [Deltaproteobacteria bacterium]
MQRETWKSRVGIILAVAGSAVGLGNFLRFPVQCAQNGGGAFMIPYFCALLFLGIPLMWVEWAIGRYGGSYGHGSSPGMFQRLWKNPIAKYLGSFALVVNFSICVYYVYVESWTLAYAWFSISGKYFGITDPVEMGLFLSSFQGIGTSSHFSGIGAAYLFFLLTFLANVYVLWHGIRGGIEKLCKIAMPTLFIFAIILMFRVFTLGTPDPTQPENSVINGLGFIWNPDFSRLSEAKVWLAAAGQIFFTLSVGFGCIHTYASYLKRKDDIVLNGLSASLTNEVAEVIIGGSIAIPIAVAFFGLTATAMIAKGGAFNLGFQAMPLIFQKLPLGQLFGALWFILLFFAGITSSVSMTQPAVAFLQDEFRFSRKKAVTTISVFWFLAAHLVIYFLRYGYLDEMDFWVGTLGVVLFAFMETIIFVWIFGPKNAWEEINLGADLKLPRFFLFVLKYITPVYLLFILISWAKQDAYRILIMEGVPETNVPYIITARLVLVLTITVCGLLVFKAFRKKPDTVPNSVPNTALEGSL